MKGLNVLAAFLGGAAVGAALVFYLLLKREKIPVIKSQRFFVKKESSLIAVKWKLSLTRSLPR